jgi:glutamate 5-kinase
MKHFAFILNRFNNFSRERYGGMYTKVLAAKTAAKTNINTVIASGKTNDVLTGLHAGEAIGTLIHC